MSLRLALLAVAASAAAALAQSKVSAAIAAFAPHDADGDGVVEARRLEVLLARGESARRTVIVLVESRLLPGDPVARAKSPLLLALATHAEDLAAEGRHAVVVACDLHRGAPHQDGRTVLALRALLRSAQTACDLEGALLVGRFPDALLVRTCNWRRNEKLSLPGKDGAALAFDEKTTNVRCVPEIVAHRCDLVLADLDGRWEAVYAQGPSKLPSVVAVFGDAVPDQGGSAIAMRADAVEVVDAFCVRDGLAEADAAAFALRLDAHDRDHECGDRDRARSNAMAVPDVAVSRIDARGVAYVPIDGARDAAGRPIAFAAEGSASPWRHDLGFEVDLLCDYFARNHAFRTNPLAAAADRPASFSHGLGSGFDALLPARAAWRDADRAGVDVAAEGDLVALLRWLQAPAVLRSYRVHSDPFGGACARTAPTRLEDAIGASWLWKRDGATWRPTWQEHRSGRADFAFYRAAWQHGLCGDGPFVLVHAGCEALSPPASTSCAYDDDAYGRFAHAESMLFFTSCVAMVGRAKVFYDDPRGFAAALGEGATVGEAWRRYFEIESAARDWSEVGGDIGRKRAYFWSVVGDFTLRLPRR